MKWGGPVLGYKYSNYLLMLHENEMWFSEIMASINQNLVKVKIKKLWNYKLRIINNMQEVEREISFRTEQGLYYSYFKQVA